MWTTNAVSFWLRALLTNFLGFLSRLRFRDFVTGRIANRQSSGIPTVKAVLTSIGRATAAVVTEAVFAPMLDMICTSTSPTTSSMTAAPVSMIPSRVFERPLVFKSVNVVPRLVEHSAAPAVKEPRDVVSARGCRK